MNMTNNNETSLGTPVLEIPAPGAVAFVDEGSRYSLAEDIRRAGHELSHIEGLLLDVAQTLNKKFKRGLPAVPLRIVKRVLRRYHGDEIASENIEAVADKLVTRGILWRTHRTIQLALKEFLVETLPSQPSRLERLVDTPMQRAFLTACDDCCGVGFNNGNVAARAAVKSLMMARFDINKTQFNRIARELLGANVIAEVNSKGSTAFMLLSESIRKLKTKKAAKPQQTLSINAGSVVIHVNP